MKIKQNCECGNLLDGKTSSFPDIVIYNGMLDGIIIQDMKPLPSNVESELNDIRFLHNQIVSKIDESLSKLNSDIGYQLLIAANPNTRGVYSTVTNNSDLFTQLSSNYKSGSSKYLLLPNTSSMFKFSKTKTNDDKIIKDDNTQVEIGSVQLNKYPI